MLTTKQQLGNKDVFLYMLSSACYRNKLLRALFALDNFGICTHFLEHALPTRNDSLPFAPLHQNVCPPTFSPLLPHNCALPELRPQSASPPSSFQSTVRSWSSVQIQIVDAYHQVHLLGDVGVRAATGTFEEDAVAQHMPFGIFGTEYIGDEGNLCCTWCHQTGANAETAQPKEAAHAKQGGFTKMQVYLAVVCVEAHGGGGEALRVGSGRTSFSV